MRVSTLISSLVCLLFHVLVSVPIFSQDYWERLPGPYGASVQQLEWDGSDLYALTTGGIYKSDDKGATWMLVEGNVAMGISKPSSRWFAKILHVENGDWLLIKNNYQLRYSENAGKTWKTVLDLSPSATAPSEGLVSCFISGDTLFASSTRALYRSVNKGESWEKVPDPGYYGPIHLISKIKNTYIGRRDYSIQVSSDGGWQWKNVFAITPKYAAVATIDTTIFGMYSDYARLIRSRNLGASWEKFDTDTITYWQYNTGIPGWLSGTGGDLFFGTENGCQHAPPQLYYSPDKGKNWKRTNQGGFRDQQLRDMTCTDNYLMMGAMDGFYRSTDQGHSFSTSNMGMNAARISDVFQRPDNSWWVVARQGVFRSNDQGQNWMEVFPNDHVEDCGMERRLPRTAKRMFYPGHNTCLLVSSEDNGLSWHPSPILPPQFPCPAIITTERAAWFLSYSAPLYVWRDEDTAPMEFVTPFLDKVKEYQAGNGVLFLSNLREAFVSADEGGHWQELPPLEFWAGTPGYGSHIAIDRFSVFRSGGNNWDTVFKLDYQENIWHPYFPIDAATGDTINWYNMYRMKFEGGIRWMGVRDKGLYYSTLDSPDQWYPYHAKLPEAMPLSVHLAGNEIWLGTEGAGLFRAPLHVRLPESPAPRFMLFPNPGKGEALNISSNQFFSENLYLRVFDAAGKLRYEQVLSAGQFWTTDLSNLPRGMYVLEFGSPGYLYSSKWIKH